MTVVLQSQTSGALELNYNPEEIHLDHLVILDPNVLSDVLTKNKKTEKEKFDALFGWVASNIRYDFYEYYSPNGSSPSKMIKVLGTKRGICMDYATLMDALCARANITNVSVYGYAKDEIFDVNDSIYVDNHVWNAVKLDGLWYLYDATWAAGEVEYHYTRWSRWILKIIDKFPEKYKKKKFKKRKTRVGYSCDAGATPVYYYVPRRLNHRIKKFLSEIRLSVRQSFVQRINTNYYLTSPEMFAVTHFPDNPIWSFLPEASMRGFETDSLYYHLSDESYLFQNRRGSVCAECDSQLVMDELQAQKYLREQSIKLNKRNHFITASSEYQIAEILFNRSKDIPDSASKITLLDTSYTFLQLAKFDLKECSRNNKVDFQLQNKKNRFKQKLLLTDNKKHLDFVRNRIEITLTSDRSNKELSNKISAQYINIGRRKTAIESLKTSTFINKNGKTSEKKMTKLNERLELRMTERDSLNLLIFEKKSLFDSLSKSLSFQIWQKVLNHKNLIQPIVDCIQMRKFLKDNFKKTVVESRKQLSHFEDVYSADLDANVYNPCAKLSTIGNELYSLIAKRNYISIDIYNLKLSLVKFNQLPESELPDFKDELQKENKNDYCWLKDKFPDINSIALGFEALHKEQNNTLKVIEFENEIERYRAAKVNKELLRRKRKYESIVSNNAYLVRCSLNGVKKEKRNYLERLKTERKINAVKK